LLFLALLPTQALAAGSTLPALTAAGSVLCTRFFYYVQGSSVGPSVCGGEVKATAAQLASYILGTYIPAFPLTISGGTSGGIPYFSSTSALTSSGALTANLPV